MVSEDTKNVRFWTPLKAENEAGAWAPARFSLFTEVHKKRPKSCQNGFQKAPKSDPKRPEGVPRTITTDIQKMIQKSMSKWRAKGCQMGGAAESPFLVSGEQRAPRGVLKDPLELPGVSPGCILTPKWSQNDVRIYTLRGIRFHRKKTTTTTVQLFRCSLHRE